MAYVIGIILALGVSAYATVLRLDRDRAFYPTAMIVIASTYVLFAAIGGASGRVLVVESLLMSVFVAAASVGFRRSLWLVAAALAGHGVLDLVHAHLIVNPGVPVWWPAFCSSYDIAAAAYLAWRLTRASAGTNQSPNVRAQMLSQELRPR